MVDALQNTRDHHVDQIATLGQERDQFRDRLTAVSIENAELHGFINRVEIEDDKAWFEKHGARGQFQPDAQATISEVIPPLCQRLRFGSVHRSGVTSSISDRPTHRAKLGRIMDFKS